MSRFYTLKARLSSLRPVWVEDVCIAVLNRLDVSAYPPSYYTALLVESNLCSSTNYFLIPMKYRSTKKSTLIKRKSKLGFINDESKVKTDRKKLRLLKVRFFFWTLYKYPIISIFEKKESDKSSYCFHIFHFLIVVFLQLNKIITKDINILRADFEIFFSNE